MARILAIILLFTIVYSWEEFKLFLRKLVFYFLKTPPLIPPLDRRGTDQKVGTLVILATVPIGLFYYISHAENIWARLIWIGAGLLAIAGAAIASEILLRRAHYATTIASLVVLFSPVVAGFAETAHLPRKVLAKFALLLSIPVFVGLLLRYTNNLSPESLIAGFDLLTIILIGSLFLRLTIDLLEHYFQLYRLEKLFSYFRVALGVALAGILLLK
ncbi:MAG: hypothetical protein Q8R08_02815 [bacterium]|nr:hypothetical protein [bacterium]